jgi:hypothetical protein
MTGPRSVLLVAAAAVATPLAACGTSTAPRRPATRTQGPLHRFGAPVAVRTEQGRRCAYYEVVGRPRDAWRFCFAPGGHMLSAGGNAALP